MSVFWTALPNIAPFLSTTLGAVVRTGSAATDASFRLSPSGLIAMVISVSGVTLLFGWCVYRVLQGPVRRPPHRPQDVDLQD